MNPSDATTVGLSRETKDYVDELQELGFFRDKMDCYRFGASLALAYGVNPPKVTGLITMFNVGSLDPENKLKVAVEAIMGDQLGDTSSYRMVERLAEWGIREMHRLARANELDFEAIFSQVIGMES